MRAVSAGKQARVYEAFGGCFIIFAAARSVMWLVAWTTADWSEFQSSGVWAVAAIGCAIGLWAKADAARLRGRVETTEGRARS